MITFLTLFAVVLIFVGVPLGILGTINALRKKHPGCSGSHDCVVFKGERVTCPSCDLRELKAEIAAAKLEKEALPNCG
jgi:hypothetical protein